MGHKRRHAGATAGPSPLVPTVDHGDVFDLQSSYAAVGAQVKEESLAPQGPSRSSTWMRAAINVYRRGLVTDLPCGLAPSGRQGRPRAQRPRRRPQPRPLRLPLWWPPPPLPRPKTHGRPRPACTFFWTSPAGLAFVTTRTWVRAAFAASFSSAATLRGDKTVGGT